MAGISATSDRHHVVVVGALEPYLRRLKARGKPFVVLEMDTAALKADELPFYRHADDWPEVIPQADVLIVTGTTPSGMSSVSEQALRSASQRFAA